LEKNSILQNQSVFIKKPKSSLLKRIMQHKFLYLIGLPGILNFLIFKYWPMYGILIAFKDYNPFIGVFGSDWVGLDHFIKLFTDPDFYMIFRNTLTISLLSLLLFPAPIIMALLLNEVKSSLYKRSIQTIVYIPHFLSWVVVVSITYLFLSEEQGLVNKIISQLGGQTHPFMFDPKSFYPLILGQSIWKNVGWGSIVYLAAIAGVDVSLYEAAVMDGAGKLRQIWSITIPSIMPTIVVLFILNLGHILDTNFEQIWLMQNPLVNEIAEVFETYVYKTGIKGGEYSYTTAVGMFKSVIGLILVIISNKIVTKKGYEGIF
jgi:putative aldouronate transport system permease protein